MIATTAPWSPAGSVATSGTRATSVNHGNQDRAEATRDPKSLNHKDLSTLLASARDALVAGDWERAEVACQAVLAAHPKHIEATCLLAESYRERDLEAPATDLFQRVLSADPENLIARWALA